MELQNLALKNRIKAATIETNKKVFIYIVKNKIQYGINDNGVIFNITELSEKHTKAINKIIDKSEPIKVILEVDKNLNLEL
jgi:hypothetical protein